MHFAVSVYTENCVLQLFDLYYSKFCRLVYDLFLIFLHSRILLWKFNTSLNSRALFKCFFFLTICLFNCIMETERIPNSHNYWIFLLEKRYINMKNCKTNFRALLYRLQLLVFAYLYEQRKTKVVFICITLVRKMRFVIMLGLVHKQFNDLEKIHLHLFARLLFFY